MKNLTYKYSKIVLVLGLIFTAFVACDRDLTDEAVEAGFSDSPNVFIDAFSSGLNYFPFQGSVLNAFSVDTETKYNGSASMRFDVPNVGDPLGSYAGAIFPVPDGRDLTAYDALTFWAKATQAGTINEIGFGTDFGENKYNTVLPNLTLTTNWRKYIIPIPDPSKLTQERGLFWYAEGPEEGAGYTFWVDDVKYEKLGTIAQPRPAILGGQDQLIQTFIGASGAIGGLTQTFSLASGVDQTVNAAPSYFEFTSSNPNVASVDVLGNFTALSTGETVITAKLNGVDASGSITVSVLGEFIPAPTPTEDPNRVISIFSDAYTNVAVDYYNGYFNGDGQTTQGQDDLVFNGDNVINYTDLNFVGIGTFLNVPTVDASQMTHIHLDINVQEVVDAGDQLTIQLLNGVQTGNETSGSVILNSTQLLSEEWASFDIPLGQFSGLASRDNIGLLFFISNNSSNVPTISNIFVDNIYFYATPTSPLDAPEVPTEDEVANNVISIYSDAYTDVGNNGLNNFNSGSLLSIENIASNDVLKYSNLNFTGLEFLGPNLIDASATTTLHLDVWSPDENELKIKLVDFGADESFQGGDDTEFEINFGPTAAGEWISYDIPLSDFTGLLNTDNLAQIILVNAPTGTIFVDNLYLYN